MQNKGISFQDATGVVATILTWSIFIGFVGYALGEDCSSPTSEQCYQVTSNHDEYENCNFWTGQEAVDFLIEKTNDE